MLPKMFVEELRRKGAFNNDDNDDDDRFSLMSGGE